MSLNKTNCCAPLGDCCQGLVFSNGNLTIYPNGNTVDLSSLSYTNNIMTYLTDVSLASDILSITYVGENGIPQTKNVFLPYGDVEQFEYTGLTPIIVNNTSHQISIIEASSTTSGSLSSTDWNIFDAKQDPFIATNGLYKPNDDEVRWGGTLIENTTVDQAGFPILFKEGDFTHEIGDSGSFVDPYSIFIDTPVYMQSLRRDGAGVQTSILSSLNGEQVVIEAQSPTGTSTVDAHGGDGIYIIQTDGKVFIPNLASVTTTDVIYYDSINGLITYGPAPTGGGGDTYTVDNGLTASTATNFQLGGTLLHNTTISQGSSDLLIIAGTNGTSTFVDGTLGITTPSNVISFSSQSAGLAGQFNVVPSSTNTTVTAVSISRETTGTASNNIGVATQYAIELSNGTVANSNRIASKWTNVTSGAQTSRFEIYGTNAAVESRQLAIEGSGQVILDAYGDGLFTGTATKWLAVDTNGNVIEENPPSVAASYTVDNGLTASTSTNFQLGGTLLHDTLVTGDAFEMAFTSTRTTSNTTLRVNNTSSGEAIQGLAVSGIGVRGQSTSNLGVGGSSSSSHGGQFSTSSSGAYGVVGISPGVAGHLLTTASGTNDINIGLTIVRQPSGTPLAGLGTGLGIYGKVNGDAANYPIALLQAKWTDPLFASRSGMFEIHTTNTGSTARKVAVGPNGEITFDAYGAGTFTGTVAKILAVTSAGAVIETNSTSVGNVYTASNGLTMSSNNTKLGGALIEATTISSMSNTNTVTWTGAYTGAGQVFTVANTTSGSTLGVTNNGGSVTATIQNNGNGDALLLTSAGSRALRATSIGGPAAYIDVNPSSTNTTVTIAEFTRFSSGTPAANMGGAIQISLETTTASNTSSAGKISAVWSDPALATKSSDITIQAANNGSNVDILKISGNGDIELLVTGAGLIMKSPDGTRYKATMANGGTWSIAAA